MLRKRRQRSQIRRADSAESGPRVVVHVGNSVGSEGGIASVIGRHCARELDGYDVRAISSYDPGRPKGFRRSLPCLRVLPRLATTRRLSAVHVHVANRGSVFREGLLALLVSLVGVETLVTMHGSGLLNCGGITRRFLAFVLSKVSVVHGFSENYRFHFEVPPAKWRMIPNDVEMRSAIPPVLHRSKKVLFVGEVGFRKGADILIEAWKNADTTGWQLDIIGRIMPEIDEYLSKGSLPSNCTLRGPISRVDVLDAYLDCRIVVLPSRAEAFSMSVCEGLAAGCAVIGTKVGAMEELLSESGQLVMDDVSSAALTRKFEMILGDERMIYELSECGHEFAAAVLSSEVVDRQWASTYYALAGNSPVGGLV